jgi:ribonuclease HI
MLDTTQSSAHVHIWEKLKANWLKCNVDGAVFSTERKFDIGICFRNVQAHTMYFPFEVTLNKCEASTPKHTLLIALSSDFERVVFETDSQIVINSILNG